jgi:PEP-CTERM motif
MRYFRLVLASLILVAAPTSLLADSLIPYPNKGVIAPTSSLTATNTGEIIGYFTTSGADYTDYVRLLDVTSGYTSAYAFDNHTTAIGTSYDFGSVTAGDVLVFELLNGLGQVFASDPAYSLDDVNHAYVVPFAGGTLSYTGDYVFPAGTYVGMEDSANGSSDFDYRDDSFIFDNITVETSDPNPSPVPEPSTLAMFGTGALAALGVVRRKAAGR